jgi:hypothetical protein
MADFEINVPIAFFMVGYECVFSTTVQSASMKLMYTSRYTPRLLRTLHAPKACARDMSLQRMRQKEPYAAVS